MSQTYTVQCAPVTESVSDRKKINYPPFIEGAAELMAEELSAAGWTVLEGRANKTFESDVVATVALATGEIEIHSKSTQTASAEGYSGRDNRTEGERIARTKLGEASERAREAAQQEAERQLIVQEPKINAEIRAAHTRMVAQGLRKKAAKLGSVSEVTEGVNSQGQAVTTIRVKV